MNEVHILVRLFRATRAIYYTGIFVRESQRFEQVFSTWLGLTASATQARRDLD